VGSRITQYGKWSLTIISLLGRIQQLQFRTKFAIFIKHHRNFTALSNMPIHSEMNEIDTNFI